MKKLLLALIIAAGASSLHSMEPQKQLSLIFLAQTYHQLSKLLLPDITQQIFSLQLKASGIDPTELPQSCKHPITLVCYIERLIESCGYELASELLERYFSHVKISICDIKDQNNRTPLYYATGQAPKTYPDRVKDQKVIMILIKIASHNAWTLLTTKETLFGNTVFHSAASSGHIEIMELLLNAAGNNTWTLLTMQNNQKDTALHTAARYGRTEMVKFLLDTAGDKVQDLMAMQSLFNHRAHDLAHLETREVMEEYLKNNQ